MLVNLHTHTFRCGHASGTEREYIENAIKAGIKILGFSDHCPYVFPNGYQSSFRVQDTEAADYFETISKLRAEYSDRIKIRIGFEMEYYPSFFSDMYTKAKEKGAEYFILGQHFITDEVPEGIHSCSNKFTIGDNELSTYVDSVVCGMKTGAFTYVAHPDMIKYKGKT